MKTLKLLGLYAALSVATVASAQKGVMQTQKPAPAAPLPPPVFVVDPPPDRLPVPPPKPAVTVPAGPQTYVFEQKPLAGKPMVLTPDQAQAIINRFKTGCGEMGNPRLLVSVSRDLTASGSAGADDAEVLTDVERLFRRPLAAAGAVVADAKAASGLSGGAADRDALGKTADVLIEVVITSKTVSTSDGKSVVIPEIKSKAVRLSDSKILGQAASTNITNRIPPATLANYDVRELAEVGALALMEQMAP